MGKEPMKYKYTFKISTNRTGASEMKDFSNLRKFDFNF